MLNFRPRCFSNFLAENGGGGFYPATPLIYGFDTLHALRGQGGLFIHVHTSAEVRLVLIRASPKNDLV